MGLPSRCPLCKVESVKKQYTWKGIICAILCFPCGIYWCLRKKVDLFCPLCGCQVVSANGRSPLIGQGYVLYQTFRQNSSTENDSVQTRATTLTTAD